tara:strand:+ start:390 stop:650 length:261 start_codon:yes stop_codon:yes gene_type:complete
MKEVKNLKQLSAVLNKKQRFLLSVTFLDNESKELHTSAFTNNFPTADLPIALKDMAKVVNQIERNELIKENDPNGHQNNAVKDMIS